ncbi:MAG: hypothetical protein AAFQ82_09770, partial [Myxococcota bacterium]
YASLMLTLNPYLPEDTEFEAPSLSLTTESGESIASLPLAGSTDTSAWQPGGVAVIPNIDLEAACPDQDCVDALSELGNGTQLELQVGINTGGESGLDASALTVY